MDGAFGRNPDISVKPPDQEFADLARAPVRLLGLELDNQPFPAPRFIDPASGRPASKPVLVLWTPYSVASGITFQAERRKSKSRSYAPCGRHLMVLALHSDQLSDAVLLMDRQDLVLWKRRGGWLSWLMRLPCVAAPTFEFSWCFTPVQGQFCPAEVLLSIYVAWKNAGGGTKPRRGGRRVQAAWCSTTSRNRLTPRVRVRCL